MKRRPTKPRTRHLTFLLIRADIQSPEAALKNPERLVRKPLADDVGFEGVLYLFEPPPRAPRWLDFIEEAFPGGISLVPTAPAAVVLFVRADSRLFALTFGQGRHLLKPDSHEVDFGLKTTLNTVDEKRLRSLDSRTFEELTVHTRRQLSRSSSLEAFSVDVVRDLLGAVTGEPADTSLARRLTGRDALALTGAVAFSGLADKCAVLLRAYESTRYQEKFPWVDNIRLVKEPALVDQLDRALLRKIHAREFHMLYLAPPEVIPWNEVAGFRYPGERANSTAPHPDLDLEECLAALARRRDVETDELELSLEELKRWKIRVVYEDSSFEQDAWSVYDCLIAELEHAGALGVLSAGKWFRIEKNFAGQTRQEAAGFVKEIKVLPLARSGEHEDEYNEKAARASQGLVLLDKNLLKIEGARTSFEACDLFSTERQFIHVKRKARSSALSHLFAQGSVAAETFLSDASFRKKLKEQVKGRNAALADLLGDPPKRPEPERFEIVFAIITSSSKQDWPQSLPFFSQLNFVRSARHLRMLGFRVALCGIGEEK